MPKYTILIGEKYIVEAENEADAIAKLDANSTDLEFIEVDTWVVEN